MKGDNVTKQYYGRRLDGVDLYRYAVPNVRTEPKPIGELIVEDKEKYWTKPQFMILQHPTEQEYVVLLMLKVLNTLIQKLTSRLTLSSCLLMTQEVLYGNTSN